MGVTYTQGTDVSALEPGELGAQLEGVVTAAMVWLGGFRMRGRVCRSARESGTRNR